MEENNNVNTANSQEGQSRKSSRGFASMDKERQRKIASEGGRAAHKQGVAHEWSSAEAREAGRKGGQNSHGGGRNSRVAANANESATEVNG
jgi:uncharacterized protein